MRYLHQMPRVVGWLLWCCACNAIAQSQPIPLSAFQQSTLQIITPDARVHNFTVWLADTPAKQQQGLMYVKTLKQTQGMLFVFDTPRPVAMWMKNTFIALDMIFIRADGYIESIHQHAKPHSLKTIASQAEVLAVLELPAGTAAQLHLVRGAAILHPAFSNHPD